MYILLYNPFLYFQDFAGVYFITDSDSIDEGNSIEGETIVRSVTRIVDHSTLNPTVQVIDRVVVTGSIEF